MTDWRDFGAQLRREREAAGMSIGVLAERLRIKPNTLSGYETGRTKPGPDTVRRARRIFPNVTAPVCCGRCGAEF